MPVSDVDPEATAAVTQQFSKPAILQRMDEASLKQTAASLKKIRDDLDNKPDLVALATSLKLVVGAAEEYHIRDHWLDEKGGGWFKAVPNVGARLRAGFRETVRLLRQNPRPVDMFLQVIANPPGGGFTFTHLMVPGRLVVILTVPKPVVPAGTQIQLESDDLISVTAQFGDSIETRAAQVGVDIVPAAATTSC